MNPKTSSNATSCWRRRSSRACVPQHDRLLRREKEEALRIALELIPEGSAVTMGGAMSAHEIGLVDALKKGNYNFIDRDATRTSAPRCSPPTTRTSSSPAPTP